MRSVLSESKRQDLIDSILLYNEDYADNVGISFIGPTAEELESFTDAELEQELEFAKSSARGSIDDAVSHVGEHEEFFRNVDKMDREQLLSQFSDIYKEKNGTRPHLDQSKWSDDELRDAIKELSLEEDLQSEGVDFPESVLKIIVAEGAALKTAGLLEQFELNYDAIEEAIYEEALSEGLGDDVMLPRRELLDLIAAMDPEEVAGGEYVDEDTGEVLLARGQKAGSSYVHPDYKHVKRPSRYMDDEPDYEGVEPEGNVQNQYQTAIEMYAADFAGENFDDPEGAATDAAESFFVLNPEWKMWSKALGISRADMKSQVADLIHSNLIGEGLQLEAEYKGREVPLGKPMKGDTAKFKVYVKDKKTGNVKKVNFGAKGMEIRRDNPKARKNFRARHGCGTSRASDRTKAAYWSCRMWSTKPVSKIVGGK